MARLFFVATLALCLAGSIHHASGQLPNLLNNIMPQGQLPNMMPQGQQQPNGLLQGLNGMLPGQQGNQNPLSNLLGNNGNGITETLRNLPQRGMNMLNQVVDNVRSMLNGLGRNGNGMNFQNPMQNPQNPMQNMQNPLQNMQNPLQNMQNPLQNMQNPLQNMQNPMSNLPDVNQLARPVTDALQQGRLPDLNQMTQGLSSTINGLTRSLSNSMPANGQVMRP